MLFGQMATRTRMTGFIRRNNRADSIVISFRKARQIFAGLFLPVFCRNISFTASFRRVFGIYQLMSVKDPREKSIYQLVSVKGIPGDSIYQLMSVRGPPVKRICQLMSVKGIPADRDFHRMINANPRLENWTRMTRMTRIDHRFFIVDNTLNLC